MLCQIIFLLHRVSRSKFFIVFICAYLGQNSEPSKLMTDHIK